MAEGVRRSSRLRGVRTRVVVGYVVLLAASLGIVLLVVRQALLARLDRAVDEALAQEVEELRLLAGGTDPGTGEPFGTDATAVLRVFLQRSVPAANEAFYTFVDGEPFQRSFGAPVAVLDDAALVDAWTSATTPRRVDRTTSAGTTRSLAVPLRDGDAVGGVFVVAAFVDGDRSEVDQTIRVVAVTSGLVLVVSAAIASSLAGRVLRPVRELTRTARGISESELTGRIPVEGDDELAELGRTFNAMVDRLEAGFRTQRQFLDDVAHELRTPITIVRGHLDVFETSTTEQRETIDLVGDELDIMSRYVADLLVLAKAEQPDFLRLEASDVGEFAHQLVPRLTALGDRTWRTERVPEPGRTAVVADPGRLAQAVLNLAGNAVEHTGPGDEIELTIAVHADRYRIQIRDTGPGFDDTVADGLFRRHERGGRSRVSRPDGTGIGLSIVAAIARAHGGAVSATGTPGVGATFTLDLPIDPHPPDPSPDGAPP